MQVPEQCAGARFCSAAQVQILQWSAGPFFLSKALFLSHAPRLFLFPQVVFKGKSLVLTSHFASKYMLLFSSCCAGLAFSWCLINFHFHTLLDDAGLILYVIQLTTYLIGMHSFFLLYSINTSTWTSLGHSPFCNFLPLLCLPSIGFHSQLKKFLKEEPHHQKAAWRQVKRRQ